MTIDSKRAKECILVASEWNGSGQCDYNEYKEAIKFAADVLDRQIPREPEITLKGTTGMNTFVNCPRCKTLIIGTENFCPDCGQALDQGAFK